MNHSSFLLIVATEMEIAPIIEGANLVNEEPKVYQSTLGGNEVDILIGGVGLPFTTYSLTKILSKHSYKFVINAGIGGAFNRDLKLGSVVHVVNELFADIGVLSDDKFSNLFDMDLLKEGAFPFTQQFIHNYSLVNNKVVESLETVNGVTVNTIVAKAGKSDPRYTKLNPHIENMEGAAVFYVCMMERIPFIEIRSVSNYVGEIDKELWNIPLAVENLNTTVRALFKEIK